MRTHSTIAAFVFCSTLVGLTTGCSETAMELRIQPFEQNRIELQVNQVHVHKVRLSTKVSEKTYVDLDYATQSDFLEIPEFIVFKAGENLQTVNVVGKAATNVGKAGFMELTFTLRGTSMTQIWYYRVVGSSDPGPLPDSGAPQPRPDTGPAPDTAPDPDTGPAPDASEADATAVAPDATPDA